MMVEETKLLLGLQMRKRNAIERAIELYTPYLGTVLYRMVGTGLPKEDIEEIVADVFVTLWKNAAYIDLEKGTLRSYIAAVARNLALKRLSKRKEMTCLEDVDLPDETDFSVRSTESEVLWKAVMELGEPDNEIFVRFYKYDESLRDIARATGLNISTVKTKLSRGKHRLKKILLHAEESL